MQNNDGRFLSSTKSKPTGYPSTKIVIKIDSILTQINDNMLNVETRGFSLINKETPVFVFAFAFALQPFYSYIGLRKLTCLVYVNLVLTKPP